MGYNQMGFAQDFEMLRDGRICQRTYIHQFMDGGGAILPQITDNGDTCGVIKAMKVSGQNLILIIKEMTFRERHGEVNFVVRGTCFQLI